jgi:outer membrane protein assembly factor BamB
MHSFLKKCAIFLFTAVPVLLQAQTADGRQGLVTDAPYWRQALGGSVLSLPSVQVQSAVVALDGGNIRAYSTAGTPMWNYSARGRISPYVTRSREGTSYFSRNNGIFIAVNRAGRELWRRNLGSPLTARAIPGWDGRLFVPTDKKISCYTASGNLLWSKTFDAPCSIPPRLDSGGGILLALENNEVYRIDAFGNSKIWTLSSKPAVLLSIEHEQILVLYADGAMGILGQSEDWFLSAQGEAHAILLPMLPASPVAAANRGNVLAVILADGMAALFSVDERKTLWSTESHIRELIKNGTRPEPEAEVVYDERGIYVLSKNGATGFSHEGKRLWYRFLENTAAIPAFGNDGVLYSGGKDWILYAYKIEDRILPVKTSLYGPLPEGTYGTGLPKPSIVNDFPMNEYEINLKLQQINAGLLAGKVGENELPWTTTLMMIASGNFHIKYKIESLKLLGQIGSQETISWLVNFFRRDNDPMVRAAAVSAVGDIGVDPEGVAIQTFLFLLVNGGGIKDEQILLAITSATGALCRFSGPPLSESGIRILTLLTADHQPPSVRRQAQREIAQLR